MGISDCTKEIYVAELKSIRGSGSEDSDIITAVYDALDSLWNSSVTPETDRDWLRGQFEDDALIYVESNEGPSWRKTTQCVWSTAARLRDMVSLNVEYEDLKDFFVDIIGVKPVTLMMAIDELKDAGRQHPLAVSIEEVKASLLTVNSLLFSESDEKPEAQLERYNIFPVRYPGGQVLCVSAETQFFVVDLEHLRSPFENRVKILDFSLEEVVRLRRFLKWARVEDRYISQCVRQMTSVEETGAEPIPQLDRQFRYRAHALLRYVCILQINIDLLTELIYRIAKHFESPRVTGTMNLNAFYDLLRNAKIFATDRLFLQHSLSQDGLSHTVEGGSMNVHLHEEDSTLKIYLPRKRASRKLAVRKHLPERILQWLMTDEDSNIQHEMTDKAVLAIKDVWNAPLEKLSTTLEECGIIPISYIANLDKCPEEISTDTDSDDGSDSEVLETPASTLDRMRYGPQGTYSGRNSSESLTSNETENESIALPVRLSARSRPATSLEELPAHDVHYVRVLETVIASARTSTIPDRNRNQPSTARRESSNIYGSDQFERDCKVGAAGELFVSNVFLLDGS